MTAFRLLLTVLLFLPGFGLPALEVVHHPDAPESTDAIQIELRNCRQPGVLHWGVNARGTRWEKANPVYWPPGTYEDGVASRTPLSGPDSQGVCRVTLGPFNHPTQSVGSVDFAVLWDDGSWDSNDGNDYHISVHSGRITVEPANPSLNDVVTVTIHRAADHGLLRWGVNAKYGEWMRPVTNYWPDHSIPSDDGFAVDSPLPPPDKAGQSVLRLGPFNQPEQIVSSLHLAVHWGDEWDTDFGRNYNVPVSLQGDGSSPVVRVVSPTHGQLYTSSLSVSVVVERADSVCLWLDGSPMVSLLNSPWEWSLDSTQPDYGPHRLIACATNGDRTGIASVDFWRVPTFIQKDIPRDLPQGFASRADGYASFVLHAPGKHFVSVVGDFNGWNPMADLMNCSPDGTWWLIRDLGPGEWKYQYCIDGVQFLADPYSVDVEWKNEKGEETYLPNMARSVARVGAPAFEWTDASFKRPPLENLLIYEFHINDFCPGQGFTGVIARLDYLRDLGINAIEPLPFNEFPGAVSWGYNPAFHLAPETSYGTVDELKRLIDEAHRRGIAVIMDMVLNHMDVHSSLYQLYGRDFDASPYFRLFLGENWGFPDLDQPAPAFKRYAADLLQFWVREYHVDGFRYDATRWVGWQGYNDWGAGWFAYAAKQADPGTYQIAEHLPADPDLQNKTEMDSGWHDYFRWKLRDMIKKAELDRPEFARLLDARSLGFSNSFQRIAYVESHDEERFLRELTEAGFDTDEAVRRSISALALTLTAPGVAMVYAGQEFGEATPKVVGPNPLHWDRLENPEYREMFSAFKALAHLRTRHPALRTENVAMLAEGLPPDVALYERVSGSDAVVVLANFGKESVHVKRSLAKSGSWHDVLNPDTPLRMEGDAISIDLLPGDILVVAKESD